MSLEAFLRETVPIQERGEISAATLTWSLEQIVWSGHTLDASQPGHIQLSCTQVARESNWLERLLKRPVPAERQLVASLRSGSARLELRARPREAEHLEGLPVMESRAKAVDTGALYDVLRIAIQLGAQIAHAPLMEDVPAQKLPVEGLRFSQGLAPAQLPDGSGWCYVDPRGNIAIPGPFAAAEAFCEQRGAVKIGEDWGFVDALGEIEASTTRRAAPWGLARSSRARS